MSCYYSSFALSILSTAIYSCISKAPGSTELLALEGHYPPTTLGERRLLSLASPRYGYSRALIAIVAIVAFVEIHCTAISQAKYRLSSREKGHSDSTQPIDPLQHGVHHRMDAPRSMDF